MIANGTPRFGEGLSEDATAAKLGISTKSLRILSCAGLCGEHGVQPVASSLRETAEFFAAGDRTVATWRRLGMPGSISHWPLASIDTWRRRHPQVLAEPMRGPELLIRGILRLWALELRSRIVQAAQDFASHGLPEEATPYEKTEHERSFLAACIKHFQPLLLTEPEIDSILRDCSFLLDNETELTPAE